MDAAIKEFKKRRADRLAARGIRPKQFRKTEGSFRVKKNELIKGLSRMDAPEGEEEEQQNSGRRGRRGGGEGHGNTRLPFGLCQRFGIEIGKEWGPREAWEALAGKGITADGAYARLKKGEDPGTPEEGGDKSTEEAKVEEEKVEEEPIAPKEPKTAITYKDKEYSGLSTMHSPWSSWTPYRVEGKSEDGDRFWMGFRTRGDLMWYLKEQGVEEINDPETGELLNPAGMELPERVMKDPVTDGWMSEISLGLRDGRYTIFGVDMDGKKRKLRDFPSKAMAMDYIKGCGGPSEDKIKMSPALKKREAERVAWLTSDKKEYIDHGGTRYGDIRCEKNSYGGYMLKASSEEEHTTRISFNGKTALMSYLKDQGVEKCKIDGEVVNPQEFEVPKTVATILGTPYQKLSMKKYGTDSVSLVGTDLDGRESVIGTLRGYESVDDFKKRLLRDGGIDESIVDVDDDAKEYIDKRVAEDEEKARRKAEFESKAVPWGSSKYMDMGIEDRGDGGFLLYGYDENGNKKRIISRRSVWRVFDDMKENGIDPETVIKDDESLKKQLQEYTEYRKKFDEEAISLLGDKYMDVHIEKHDDDWYYIMGKNKMGREEEVNYFSSFYSLEEFAKDNGVDLGTIINNDDLKKEYDQYVERSREFEAKSIEILGGRYADISIVGVGDSYAIAGYDRTGRRREIDRGDYDEMKSVFEGCGKSIDDFPMDEAAKKTREFEKKEEAAVASGEYKWVEKHAYKDFTVKERPSGKFSVEGVDLNGEKKRFDILSYDDAISYLEDKDISNYKIFDESGAEKTKPKWGMHKVMLMRKPDGGFLVYADTKKYGKHAIMCEVPKEEEARKWLRDNGVDDSNVRTRGMNPNDDIPRTHDAVSLENFDNHRMERIESSFVSRFTDKEKKEAADMLTDMFNTGAYRMNRSDNFEEIVFGHFKNLLETGTSGGSAYMPGRRETGEVTFGHAYDIEPIDAEKYGFLGVDDDVEYFGERTAGHYGGINFKFKKDRVAERTTYTFGDTLDSGRPIAGYAGSHPTIEGLDALRAEDGKQSYNKIMEMYKKYKAGNGTFSDFCDKVSDICRDGYIECQFHGMLTIEDVDSITMDRSKFDRTFGNMSEETRKNVIKKLKDCGITLNCYEYGTMSDGYERLKEKYGEA